MPIAINGSGPITGITSLNTTVSDTELGYLDGVTSAIQTQINTAGGLVKITDQSFSAASSVIVNNCFSSTYSNYLFSVSGTASSSSLLVMRFRAGGVDESGSVYQRGMLLTSTTATAFENGSSSSTVGLLANTSTTGRMGVTAWVFDPYTASTETNMHFGSVFVGYFAGYTRCTATTQFDGFTLFPNAGTITGNLRVYGYRN